MKTLIKNISDLYTFDDADTHITGADVLIEDGKFAAVGKDLSCEGVDRVISGEGMTDRKSTRLNSSHTDSSRMPSSA